MEHPSIPIEQIVAEDGRYPIEAVQFVRQGLGFAVEKIHPDSDENGVHHITGQELAEALRELAIHNWGSMALVVLNHWKILTTRDFGEIVFLLIESGWMQKQPTDRIEDFDRVYDFKTAFRDPFSLDEQGQLTDSLLGGRSDGWRIVGATGYFTHFNPWLCWKKRFDGHGCV